MYGKWENYEEQILPILDACGGHFGKTPDNTKRHYHYHVQDHPPFTFGCYGPDYDSTGKEILVSVSKCRSLYRSCGDDDVTRV